MIRPRIFVSYARADRILADELVGHLEAHGCLVWIDRNELLAGDDFVRGLTQQLARCDALVLLLTARSAASSWCQAELQRALARGVSVVVVQREPDARLPDAMERLLRDLQRVSWLGGEPQLAAQLLRARRRRLGRQLDGAAAVVGAVALLVGGGWLLSAQINQIETARRVDALLGEVRDSATTWSGDEVRSRSLALRSEPALAVGLQTLFGDTTQTLIARTNAWQALDSVRQGREREWRTYVPRIDWQGGRLADTLWANTTYGEGSIRDLVAERMRMAGLVFGPGPKEGKPGMTLTGTRIRDADAWFLRMDGTQLIDVEFENSKLRGAQLDLSGAAGVRFLSRAKSDIFLSTDVAIIEDSWIRQNQAPPGPGVLDLAEPEQEILFDGVQFVRVRFEGHFKANWFRNSHFTDCVFAGSLSSEALSLNGNQSQGSVFVAR